MDRPKVATIVKFRSRVVEAVLVVAALVEFWDVLVFGDAPAGGSLIRSICRGTTLGSALIYLYLAVRDTRDLVVGLATVAAVALVGALQFVPLFTHFARGPELWMAVVVILLRSADRRREERLAERSGATSHR